MNKRYQLQKEISFDYGHRVPNHQSKCRNCHGHRGRVVLTISGPLNLEGHKSPKEGMVLDFGEVKAALMEEIHDVLDHHFIVADSDQRLLSLLVPDEDSQPSRKETKFGDSYEVPGFGVVVELPCVPTAENLAEVCYRVLRQRLEVGAIKVVSVEFWETPTSMAKVGEQC